MEWMNCSRNWPGTHPPNLLSLHWSQYHRYFCHNVEHVENGILCFNVKSRKYAVGNTEVLAFLRLVFFAAPEFLHLVLLYPVQEFIVLIS